MTRILGRLFNIRRVEWPRFSLLYLMAFLFVIGINWAQIIVPALFLVRIGPDLLPLIFIGDAIVTVFAVAVYMNFVDRVADDKILIVITLSGALAVLAGFGLLTAGIDAIAIALLYLLFRAIRATFNLHWGVYANNFYDTRTAKRIIPVLSSAVRVGVIAAALSVLLLKQVFNVDNIILLWSLTLGMVAILAILLPRIVKGDAATATPTISIKLAKQSYWANIKEGYRYVFNSSYLRWINISVLLMMIITTLLNFEALRIFERILRNTSDITSYTAGIDLVAGLLILPIQIFLIGRIITRLGLGNANLIYPAVTLGTIGLIVGLPQTLFVAALAYFNINAFRTTFHSNTNTLLYNALPQRVKGRSRAFTNGVVMPLGTLIAGLLAGVLPTIQPIVLQGALVALGVAYLLGELQVRKYYQRALIEMLEQENFSILLGADAGFSVADATTINYLKGKYQETDDDETRLFVARILADLDSAAFISLASEAQATGRAHLRAGMLEIMIGANLRGRAAQNLLYAFLNDPEARVRKLSLAGLEQIGDSKSEDYLERCLGLLADPDLEVRAGALPPLIQSGQERYVNPAMQALDEFVLNSEVERRALGVQIIGQAGEPRFARLLLGYLNDPQDLIRLEAAIAIENLSAKKGRLEAIQDKVIEALTACLQDPSERVRLAAINTLGNIGTEAALQKLLPKLDSRNERVIREAAVQNFVKNGKAAIPIVEPYIAYPNARVMGAVVLAQIDKSYAGVIYKRIDHNLELVYKNYVQLEAINQLKGDYTSIEILKTTLREKCTEWLDESLYLLTALHGREAVEAVASALRSSSERSRANATEALETMVSPDTLSLLTPLFDPNQGLADLVGLAGRRLGLQPDEARAVLQSFLKGENDPWLQSITAFALGEIGATLYRHENPDTARKLDDGGEDRKDGRLKRRGMDKLAGLFDKIEEDEGAQSQDQAAGDNGTPFKLDEIKVMLKMFVKSDSPPEVITASRAARRLITRQGALDFKQTEELEMTLSSIERVIFLKGVSFFQNMTVDQLRALAAVSEEAMFHEDEIIFHEGDPGGTLYIVVDGKVGLERRDASGTSARLNNVGARQFFGEATLFDNSPRTTSAIALDHTLTLQLRHEPLLALLRQYPNLTLELIRILSTNLRVSQQEVATRTRTMAYVIDDLFDKLN